VGVQRSTQVAGNDQQRAVARIRLSVAGFTRPPKRPESGLDRVPASRARREIDANDSAPRTGDALIVSLARMSNTGSVLRARSRVRRPPPNSSQ
jgi:hypothetical protein